MEKNKLLLEAILKPYNISVSKKKELASILNLPENDQQDLMFMAAILVSTGTNKNLATFLGSELIKARHTIAQKPLDREHEEDQIIGHIVSSVFMDFDGNVIDDDSLFQELMSSQASNDSLKKIVAKLDSMDMDIGIVCAVYKDRFPELAEEIDSGEWKVSMECYYSDYDLKIGNLIIPKPQVGTIKNSNAQLDKDIEDVLVGSAVGNSNVSRVLRGIRFCGVGIVKNPANERSLILEAANTEAKEDTTLEAANTTEDVNNVAVLIPSRDDLVILDSNNQIVGVSCSGKTYEDLVSELAKEALEKNTSFSILRRENRIKVDNQANVKEKFITFENKDNNILKIIPKEYTDMKDVEAAAIDDKEGLTVNLPEEVETVTVTMPEPTPIDLSKFDNIPLCEVVDLVWSQTYDVIVDVDFEKLRKVEYFDPIDNRRHFREVSYILPKKKLFLVNSKEMVEKTQMAFVYLFDRILEEDRIEMFDNIIKASIIYNEDFTQFEEVMAKKGLEKSEEDYNEGFAIPRLKLLPLGSREQVIAAMSRCLHVKVDLTDREKEFMVINIIRAANKFNIDTKSFKERVSKLGF